jgi:hypothetical protein
VGVRHQLAIEHTLDTGYAVRDFTRCETIAVLARTSRTTADIRPSRFDRAEHWSYRSRCSIAQRSRINGQQVGTSRQSLGQLRVLARCHAASTRTARRGSLVEVTTGRLEGPLVCCALWLAQ